MPDFGPRARFTLEGKFGYHVYVGQTEREGRVATWRRLGIAGWVRHRDDTPWYMAPMPSRWHRCAPHTVAVVGYGIYREVIERCACGAVRRYGTLLEVWRGPRDGDARYLPGARWTERNSRRKGRAHMVTVY